MTQLTQVAMARCEATGAGDAVSPEQGSELSSHLDSAPYAGKPAILPDSQSRSVKRPRLWGLRGSNILTLRGGPN